METNNIQDENQEKSIPKKSMFLEVSKCVLATIVYWLVFVLGPGLVALFVVFVCKIHDFLRPIYAFTPIDYDGANYMYNIIPYFIQPFCCYWAILLYYIISKQKIVLIINVIISLLMYFLLSFYSGIDIKMLISVVISIITVLVALKQCNVLNL